MILTICIQDPRVYFVAKNRRNFFERCAMKMIKHETSIEQIEEYFKNKLREFVEKGYELRKNTRKKIIVNSC